MIDLYSPGLTRDVAVGCRRFEAIIYSVNSGANVDISLKLDNGIEFELTVPRESDIAKVDDLVGRLVDVYFPLSSFELKGIRVEIS